jgi:hypothetical protein
MNTSDGEKKFGEEQRIDKFLLALCFLMSAVVGYGIIHFLLF